MREGWRAGLLVIALLGAPALARADPFDGAALGRITLLAEDVGRARPGTARRELEEDLRAAYLEYAHARTRLKADHAATVARLDRMTDDPDLALPVLAARAGHYPPDSPYASRTLSHYLGLRRFLGDDPSAWPRVLATFNRAWTGGG